MIVCVARRVLTKNHSEPISRFAFAEELNQQIKQDIDRSSVLIRGVEEAFLVYILTRKSDTQDETMPGPVVVPVHANNKNA